MNKKVNSQKDINDYKIVVPMSNEAVNKIKANITKSILGVSIAGVMITGAATEAKAEVVENPTAIVQEVKEEERAQYDQEIASILKSNSSTEGAAVTSTSATETSTGEEKQTDSQEASNKIGGLDALINYEGIKNLYNESNADKPADQSAETTSNENQIEISAEAPAEGQKAGQTGTTEPNYSKDEKEIQDYNGEERYKQTDLQPGDTNQTLDRNDENEEKDGFKFELKNPGKDSPSKTEYGYEITIDKKTGQRTYTKISVTDNGRVSVNPGDKPMMEQGDKLTAESPEITYKPTEDTNIDKSGPQRPLNYEASEETLNHINNKDNDSTSFGFKDNYTQDNPKPQFFEGNFGITYKVNPWPNENDKLQELKLNKNEYKANEKYFVQGQDIDTGIKVDNIDDSAKERLVGQVYNPITGKIVPGASAYIGDSGNIFVKMPAGALKTDESGKTIINEDSIFNTPDYKGLQNLDVKFFARPRTAGEFKNIAETPDEFGETGTYTGSGAGTADINHKGTNVKIDKQGIDRYDHYNFIGDFRLNLDDTAFHDQTYKNKDIKTNKIVNTESQSAIGIRRDENLDVNNVSTKDEMDSLVKDKNAHAKIDTQFFDKENKGKDEDDQWKLSYNDELSNINVKAPKYAKAGSYVAIPITYTYTNGSTDVKTFFFVVQNDDNKIPEYETQVAYPQETQKSNPSVSTEEKDKDKLEPKSYTIEEGAEFKDDHGNEWDVSINETTGEVTAIPKDPSKFNGGERLKVPVVAHYKNELKPELKITENTKVDFVIKERFNKTPNYNAKAGKAGDTLTSDVIVNKEDEFNRDPKKFTIESNTYKDDKGNTWNVSIDENTGKVTATVPNAVEGQSIDGALLNVPVTAHYFEKDGKEVGTKEVAVQFVASGTDGKHKYTEKLPFDTKVEINDELEKGQWRYKKDENGKELKGELGSKTTEWTIIDSEVQKDPKITQEKPVDAVIEVGGKDFEGTKTIEQDIPFPVEVKVDPKLKKGEWKYEQDEEGKDKSGEAGKQEITITIKNGEVITTSAPKTTKEAKKAVILVGQEDFEGEKTYEQEIPFTVEIKKDPSLKKGEWKYAKDEVGNELKGVVGKQEVKFNIKNGEVTSTSAPTIKKAAEKAVILVGDEDFSGIVESVDKDPIPFETEVTIDPSLKPNEIVEDQKGELGEQETKITREIKNGTAGEEVRGETTRTKEPVNRKIRVGAKTDGTHEYTSKIPFGVKVEVNKDLKKGEWRYKKVDGVEQKGEVGEEKYTVTIENSKVTATSKPETTKEAKDAIIEIGEEDFTGEKRITEEVPFKVVVKKDPSLKKGEWKYDKGEDGKNLIGTPGEKERTLTIKNGEVIATSSATETKKAVDAVILVGEDNFTGTFESKKTKALEFETEYIVDESLEPGKTKVTQEGELGEEETTVSHTIVNGKVTKSEEGEAKQTKAPVKRIVKVGPAKTDGTHTYTNKKPFEVEVRVNPKLKRGEHKVVQKGVEGEEEYTITIENSKVTKTSEAKETKAPVNEIIEVGSEDFTGTFETKKTKAVEFETEYVEDETLEPGKTVVEQEGALGEEEVTVTHTIENGKVVKSEEGESKQTKAPVKRIVKVGKKPTEGETTKTIEREIPYETKVIYDDTLEAGFQKIENEGKPGKEEVTITQKVKDSKPVGEATETTKTITEKEDRVVRIGVKSVEKETELGNDTEYRHNPDLKAGETKVIEKGSKGSVKYTTTFNKETGKLEVKEERTEPKNKVVEYGSKTDGEFTYESEKAYDIIIRENPNLESGKTNVIQEGIVGKTETTVKIKNSKEVSRDTKIITEKQDKIIEIGTKNVCPVPGEDPNNPEKPDQEKPQTPGGGTPEDPGTEEPGKPGDDKPYEPGTPGGGEENPSDKPGSEEPDTPGETPDQPGTPGEDKPNEPGTPGEETPSESGSEEPGTPGEETPDQPGTTENSDTPDTIENPEVDEVDETFDNPSETPEVTEEVSSDAKRLPKTGDGINVSMYGYLMGVLGTGFLGLGALKRKKDEEEEN